MLDASFFKEKKKVEVRQFRWANGSPKAQAQLDEHVFQYTFNGG